MQYSLLPWLAYCSWHNFFKVYPGYCIWQCSLGIFLKGWILFHCVYVCADILSICVFTDGHVGCFHVFATVNNDAKNRGVQIPLVDNDFYFFQINIQTRHSQVVYGWSTLIFDGPLTVFHLILLPTVHKGSIFPTLGPTRIIFCFAYNGYTRRWTFS